MSFNLKISVKSHRNFTEISLLFCLFLSLKFQWDLTKISVKSHQNFTEISLLFCPFLSLKFHWNLPNFFSEISLRFQWNFTVILPNSFNEISLLFQWNFTEISVYIFTGVKGLEKEESTFRDIWYIILHIT